MAKTMNLNVQISFRTLLFSSLNANKDFLKVSEHSFVQFEHFNSKQLFSILELQWRKTASSWSFIVLNEIYNARKEKNISKKIFLHSLKLTLNFKKI